MPGDNVNEDQKDSAAAGPSAGGAESSSVRFGAIPIAPFDGVASKYPAWCQRMKALLRSEGLWSFVERALPGGEAGSTVIHSSHPEDPLEVVENKSLSSSSGKPLSAAEALRAERACAVLMCNIRSDELMTILEDVQDGHPHQIWSRLQKYYKKTTEAGRHLLELQWATLKQGASEGAGLFSGKVKTLALNLRSTGVTKTQEDMTFAFINGLRVPEFKDLRSPIYRKSIKDYEEAVNDALALEAQAEHDRATLKAKSGRDESAFGSEMQTRPHRGGGAGVGSSGTCFKCGEAGHMKSSCKKNVSCTHCKKAGHIEKNCWVKRPDLRPAHMQRSGKPASALDAAASSSGPAGAEEEEYMFMIRVEEANSASAKDSPKKWKFDSGASHHCAMASVPMADGQTDTNVRIRVANGEYLAAPKVGSLKLQFASRSDSGAAPPFTLGKVLQHNQMGSNLLSISHICDQGFTVQFTRDKAVVISGKTGKTVLEAPRVGGVYELEAEPVIAEAAATVASSKPPAAASTTPTAKPMADVDTKALLRVHSKLAHLSLSGMQKLQASGAVTGLEGIKIPNSFDEGEQCAPCVKGKSHRHAFANSMPDRAKATRPLQRVLSDLCGPLPPTTAGKEYLMLLVDECTRMLFGFLLKRKSEAATLIMDWSRQIKNLKAMPIGEFHSDGGGEFVNDELEEFFRVQGIKQTFTPTDTPQWNGIVERKNRTVLEACRAVMEHAGAHVSLWGDAALHVIYTQNRTLLRPGTKQVALSLWEPHADAEKPSIARIMPFGCDGWVHTPEAERHSIAKDSGRGKLESKAILHMFLGVSETRGGARMLNVHTRKIVVSRDVRFEPSKFTQSAIFVSGEGGDDGLTGFSDKIEAFTWGNEMRFWQQVSLEEYKAEQLRRKQQESGSVTVPVVPSQVPDSAESKVPIDARNSHAPPSVAPLGQAASEPNDEDDDDYSAHGSVDGDADTQPDPDHHAAAGARRAPTAAASSQHGDHGRDRSSRYPERSSRRPPWRYCLADDGDIGAEGLSVITHQLQQPTPTHEDSASNGDPQSRAEAMASKDAAKWEAAEKAELASMETHKVWQPAELPPGRRALGVKWVYRRKVDSQGVVNKYKARLVVKGFAQREGEYGDIIAQVLHYSSLMVIIAIVAALDYELLQGDVPTAFLNAVCKEETYVRPPDGVSVPTGWALRLLKAMYGIKQAPRAWNDEFNAAIETLGYTRCTSDTCVYVKTSHSGKVIIIPIFVDDMFPACAKEDLAELRKDLQVLIDKYKIAEFGPADVMLGMRITRDRKARTIKLEQTVFIRKLLRDYGMQECKAISTPEAPRTGKAAQAEAAERNDTAPGDEEPNWMARFGALTGSLLYLAKSTRPDIAHSTGMLSRVVSNPTHADWLRAKRILRYLAGTQELGLNFGTSAAASAVPVVSLTPSFVDADWAGDLEGRKSTTGYVTKVCGSTVSWASRKQPVVALSSAEAEYIAGGVAVQELLWLRKLLTELSFAPKTAATLMCDNQSAIAIAKDDVFHARTKHIDIKHHFIRQHVAESSIELRWVPSEDNEADILTKPLGRVAFERLRQRVLGMAL